MIPQADAGVRGPSDREVVAHLQRLARAQAHLVHAEQAQAEAAATSRRDRVRVGEIEDAHAGVLWAQAQLLTAGRASRAQRALNQAVEAERQALRDHGYGSFAAYLAKRTAKPTTEIAFELAVREYDAARAGWEALAQEATSADQELTVSPTAEFRTPEARVVHDEATATVVIDLTGENPRRIA